MEYADKRTGDILVFADLEPGDTFEMQLPQERDPRTVWCKVDRDTTDKRKCLRIPDSAEYAFDLQFHNIKRFPPESLVRRVRAKVVVGE